MIRPRVRRTRPLRYYLYISDSKLDMLFEQISQSMLKRISMEVKVDLKLASLTLRGADKPGPTRMAKLRVVERFIEAHHHIGTVQEPGREYFRGELAMQWGWLGDAVWFQGDHVDLTAIHYIGLGGSRRHLLSEPDHVPQRPRSDGAVHGIGGTNRTIQKATEGATAIIGLLEEFFQLGDFTEVAIQRGIKDAGLEKNWPLQAIKSADSLLPEDTFPVQRLSYLAIPLAEARIQMPGLHPMHGVIATPLYVAIGS